MIYSARHPPTSDAFFFLCCFPFLPPKKTKSLEQKHMWRKYMGISIWSFIWTHSFLFFHLGFDVRIGGHSCNCNGCSNTSLGGDLVTWNKQLHQIAQFLVKLNMKVTQIERLKKTKKSDLYQILRLRSQSQIHVSAHCQLHEWEVPPSPKCW